MDKPAMNNPWDEVIARNKRYWEELAPHRLGEPSEFFKEHSAFSDVELALMGEVRGRAVLQLACSTGDEAISFAQLGATVTGVDIAASHLATARHKAAEVGVEVDFIEADMMNLAPQISGFDLIAISWGGLCWVPDLVAWAGSMAQRLRVGGQLLISEHHPLWEVLSDRDGHLEVTRDYFTPDAQGYADPTKAPVVTRELVAPTNHPTSYVWNLGEVINAVISAGLTIRALHEAPGDWAYPSVGSAGMKIPATYVLSAVLERSREVG